MQPSPEPRPPSSLADVPATLLGLVSHYSPSGQEAAAVRWLVQHMQRLGFTQAFCDQAGNAVGVMGNGTQTIVLLGHIDTVQGEIPLRLEGDCFYGRGTVDAKGPLAAFVDAAAAVGEVPGWQIVVIGAVGEEADSDGARYVVDQYQPTYAIIGEPSQWSRVTLGYKGTAWFEATFRAPSSHTASNRPSVCEAAFFFWDSLLKWTQAYNRQKERQFDQITPRLRAFSSAEDGFSETATLRVGVRLPCEVSPQDWYQQVQSLFQCLEGVDCALQPIGYPIPAYRADKNTPLVRAFLQGIRAVAAAEGETLAPSFALKTGTADLNIVAPVWNCPALAYGPGDSNLDHTPEEHLSLSEYQRAVKVLERVLRGVTG
ncbi:MAG: acetyl-lysine deacetylase [Anaerolineae bacterium]|nr:MAG: acetyl-lysine deacetylase [Anaerolineae bacterium]